MNKPKKWKRLFNIELPSVRFLFPMQHPDAQSSDAINPVDMSDDKAKKKKGVALLVAIMMIAVMVTFVADLIITSQVSLELASRQRDKVKAEYVAKSGFNLAMFLLLADFGIDIAQANMSKTPITDGKGDVWTMLNGLPIGGETSELLESMKDTLDLSEVMDSGIIDSIKDIDGAFTINIEDESRKINLNYIGRRKSPIIDMVKSLFSCPIEKKFLEKKELTPEDMTYRIKDFIDSDSKPDGNLGDEDSPYRKKEPPYEAKNAPLDSIEELRLIEGWDDEMHKVFSPFLTVYPIPQTTEEEYQLNLNTTTKELLFCLIPDSQSQTCRDKFMLGMAKREEEKIDIAGGDIRSALKKETCYTGSDKKTEDKSQWFTQYSTVFRISVTGEVAGQKKELVVIIQKKLEKISKKSPFEREGTVYKVLDWKMI